MACRLIREMRQPGSGNRQKLVKTAWAELSNLCTYIVCRSTISRGGGSTDENNNKLFSRFNDAIASGDISVASSEISKRMVMMMLILKKILHGVARAHEHGLRQALSQLLQDPTLPSRDNTGWGFRAWQTPLIRLTFPNWPG